MNAKKCKVLRKMAHQMCLRPDGRVWPEKQLLIHPAHEKQVRDGERPMFRATAVNAKETFRGVYKFLKREARHA